MNQIGKLALTFLVTALVLALTSGLANASRGIDAEPAALRATSNLTFTEESGERVICLMTLRASLHRTIAKSAGALVGRITEGTTTACTTTAPARIQMLVTLMPWHIRYVGFSGTLPNIVLVLLVILGFSLELRFRDPIFNTPAANCLYRGDITTIGNGAAANEITRIAVETGGGNTLRLEEAEEILTECPEALTFSGTFTTERITLRLI